MNQLLWDAYRKNATAKAKRVAFLFGLYEEMVKGK